MFFKFCMYMLTKGRDILTTFLHNPNTSIVLKHIANNLLCTNIVHSFSCQLSDLQEIQSVHYTKTDELNDRMEMIFSLASHSTTATPTSFQLEFFRPTKNPNICLCSAGCGKVLSPY